MKKLSKLKLREFHEMNESEMKSVVGGYGSGGYGSGESSRKCASTYTTASDAKIECWTTENAAEKAAGEHGWWCCNCKEALDKC